MSSDFVEFNFPCKDCLVRAACKDKPKNETIRHLYDAHNPRCLAVPNLPPDVTYTKCLIECWVNIGTRIINGMQKTEEPKTCRETCNNIPMQYVMMLGHMANLMQWMINSTSWEKGTLHDFDAREIRLKSKHITL